MRHSRKKIAHVTFDMRIGGTEQVISSLVRNTDSTQYDVRVLCLENEVGPFGIELRQDGYPVDSLSRKPGFDISLIASIRNYNRHHRIDILHCHQYTPFVYGALAAAGSGTTVIFTEHGRLYPDTRRFKRILVNPLLRLLANEITAISSATREALFQYENIPIKDIRVIYNGIDGCRYHRSAPSILKSSLGIPSGAFVLGTVARLEAIKNHEMMIDSLKTVRFSYPDTYLVIVGDGLERSRLERLADEMNLSDHIIFTGYRKDPSDFYGIFDIFLLTSFSEGTAMTLLEAMASGKPCIATDVGGNSEVILKGQTGLLVPSANVAALTEAVCLLLGNADLRQRMGSAAQERFVNCFTVSQMVDQYQNLYAKVLESEPGLFKCRPRLL